MVVGNLYGTRVTKQGQLTFGTPSAAFARCANKGFAAKAQMCAYRNNLASLRSTVNHLASIGCTSLHVGCVNAMGEWVHNAGALTPTFEEYLEAVLGYVPQYYEDGMSLPSKRRLCGQPPAQSGSHTHSRHSLSGMGHAVLR